MSTSEGRPGERVKDARFTEDLLVVDLLDGRTMSSAAIGASWTGRITSRFSGRADALKRAAHRGP